MLMRLTIRMPLSLLLFTLTQGVANSQNVQPKENASVTVTGKVPPPYHDPNAYFQPDSLLEALYQGTFITMISSASPTAFRKDFRLRI
jgi:hypothetical protein